MRKLAWGEMVFELGKGCKDIVVQNYLTEDSYAVRKLRGPVAKVSGRLRYLNEYLPEDRDPFHAWSVIILVFFLAFAGTFNFLGSVLGNLLCNHILNKRNKHLT